MLLGFIVNTNQLVERVANNTVNVFNRGWVNQQVQVEAVNALTLRVDRTNNSGSRCLFRTASPTCCNWLAGTTGGYGPTTHGSKWAAWMWTTKAIRRCRSWSKRWNTAELSPSKTFLWMTNRRSTYGWWLRIQNLVSWEMYRGFHGVKTVEWAEQAYQRDWVCQGNQRLSPTGRRQHGHRWCLKRQSIRCDWHQDQQSEMSATWKSTTESSDE